MPPILRTERLTLSGHTPDDHDAIAAMWADPRVFHHIGGRARTREEVWTQMLRHIGQWTVFGRGMWVLRDRATGQVMGEAGLMDSRRTIAPPLDDAPEAGWILAGDAQGRGLAHEAMAAILGWTDAAGIAPTQCIIDTGNAPSIRLAARLGYRDDREALYQDKAIRVFRRGRTSGHRD